MEVVKLQDSKTKKKTAEKGVISSPKPKLEITDLKPAVHDQNRVNVYIDNEFTFSLDLSQVSDYHLKVGKILTKEEIKELEHASEFGKLYSQTLEWVLMRPHSVKETRDYLKQRKKRREFENKRRRLNLARMKSDPDFKKLAKKQKIPTTTKKTFSSDDIEKVIEKLTEKKYLDDRRFAEWYIENRFMKKGISRKRLSGELAKKGIEYELIRDLLEKSSRTDATEIRKYIIKKGGKLPRKKLLMRLLSRGYPYDLCKEMIDAYETCPEQFRENNY